jgi:F-type H+-transporting ATPase subunit b
VELSWSTFVLEIINFLVLVWILKRFLYQPVLDVIARRRKSVEDELAEARKTETEAQALKEQYAGRLKAWEQEKSEAREALTQELDQERSKRLAELDNALEQEREKARIANERSRAEAERALAQQALQQGATFAGRLLDQGAGPELEARLLDLLVDSLENLPEDQRKRLREQWADPSQAIEVSSAYALSAEQRQRLGTALATLLEGGDFRYRVDESLVAGLNIEVGSWELGMNLRDELKGFVELDHGAG